MTMLRRMICAAALVAVSAMALVGCQSQAPESESAPTSEAPANHPERIVSLSPTVTEMLYAIGAGDQVAVTDKYSNYPEEAPRDPELSGFKPNAEAVVGYTPDLVVTSQDDPKFADAIKAANIELLVLPAAGSLDEVYSQFTKLGEATGHAGEAKEQVDTLRREIDQAVALVDSKIIDAHLPYYHEVSDDLYSVADSSFLGQIYALFGMHSVAPTASAKKFPQLTNEAVIASNPRVIFLADKLDEGQDPVEFVAKRPGWETIDAVANKRVTVLDKDLASRWGPRLPQLVRMIAEALKDVTLPSHV